MASRHKSEFLASMSHELRTPLNAVIGFSEVLLERMFGELNERQDEYLRDILDSGRHLLELINEILDLSKVEAGQMELEPGRPSTSRSVLEHRLAMVRERAARHAITLALDVEAGRRRPSEADELRLKQVVLNLLTNAVKFTPDGGRVEVTAGATDDEVVVTVQRHRRRHCRRQDRERIFEAFQQGARGTPDARRAPVSASPSPGGSSSSTGAALARQRGRAGQHVRVLLVPPFATPRLRRRRRGATDDRAVVVVVEDDDRSVELLRLHLDGVGFAWRSARDGEQGLGWSRSLPPGRRRARHRAAALDGWDVLARLKADP